MLQKKERLTKKEFDRFFSSGRRYHSIFFTLVYSQDNDFHAAVVVGKKIYKKAVDRNRLRRRLYHIVYRLSRAKDMRGVYIILTKPAAKEAEFSDLRLAVEKTIATLAP
jgi:ribonuclease P protein component